MSSFGLWRLMRVHLWATVIETNESEKIINGHGVRS